MSQLATLFSGTTRRSTGLVSVIVLLAAACAAREPARSPYAGMERRPIKALSPEEIDDLLQGRGAGFALAAELNRYPGPRHVLDAADALGLTETQRRRTQELFGRMQAEAAALGARIVEKEMELDASFADQTATPAQVRALAAEIGELTGRLRYVHLRAHLEMKGLLTPEQVDRYDRLRGYRDGGHGHGAHPMHGS